MLPAIVAVAGWLLPGSGYVLLGQRTRGLTVGITIISLFLFGLLIAGVRVIEVPGYDAQGQHVLINVRHGLGPVYREWIMTAEPTSELRDKPWSLPQVLNGPIAIVAGIISVHEATPDPADPSQSRAPLSHVRVNEIGQLYISVAGLLNLLAIIDASNRAAPMMQLLAYSRPFMQPLPVWNIWPFLLLPLCVAVSIVYKSVKCAEMRQVPREALSIFLWILAAFAGAGVALAIVVKFG